MASNLTLLLGNAGTGKTERLLTEYREELARARRQRRPGTVLWLAPTQRAQQSIVERLLSAGDPVQLAPGVMTFDIFAEQILAAAGKPATLMSPVIKRLLLRRIVADLSQRGQLVNFASITQTTGFLDVMSSFISELKQEEIWPDAFLDACAKRPPTRAKRDKELGLIYSRYQQHLEQQNWYDSEGRFWLARTALADGVRDPFASVEFLAVDGFADFTQTQYEIFGHLMSWIPRAIVSLPYENPLTRPELFDKPGSTIKQIRRHLPPGTTCHEEHLTADRSGWSGGLKVVSESLFANPRAMTASSDSSGLEVIAATGPLGEWEAVASRIKRLLNAGTPPSQIIVAVRSVAETGPVWKDYFDQAGIPNWCEAGSPLASRPIIKALFSALQLELEDWPFARLTQALGSNYFRPGWSELSRGRGARVVSTALRRFKLHAGRELILRVLNRISGGLVVEEDSTEFSDDQRADDHRASDAALARNAEAILQHLSHVTDRLRQRRTLSDWGDAIGSLGQDLGWQKSELQNSDETPGQSQGSGVLLSAVSSTSRDRQDWDLLQRILRTAGEADRRLAEFAESKAASTKNTRKKNASAKSLKQTRLDLAEFTAELRDLLGGEQIKAAGDPGGCVRILDVEQARHLEIPYLFIAGLAESSFPSNRSDDCLFGEAERHEFAMQGLLPLNHREQHQRDEIFLFHSIVTRARTRLTLSFPSVNTKGQPVFASPYLVALCSLFAGSALTVAHEGQLDPIPDQDRALTESDLRLLAVSEARIGNPGLFARLCERTEWLATGNNVLAAIDVNTQRYHERGFTSYEGRLASESNLNALRQRFGPHHQFSATELEAYAICPYRYWVSSVLKVDDLATPEEGTDYAARGSLVHVVLAQLLREGLDGSADDLAARFNALVEQHLAKRFHETELQRALTRVELRLLCEWGNAFALQQTDYADRVAQAWSGGMSSLPPEIPFGSVPGTDAPDEIESAALRFGDEEEVVQVRGRIDRVDVGFASGRRVFNVIDYKTGSPPKASESDLATGRSIQLALYALAVRRLGIAGREADPFQIGYWSLKATGFKRGYQRETKTFEPMNQALIDSLELTLDNVIPKLARGIREGKFLVENSDDNCTGHCAYHTTCRVNQIRPLAEKLHKIGDILDDARTSGPEIDG